MKDCSTCVHFKKNCQGSEDDLIKRKKLQASSSDCHSLIKSEKLDILNKKTNDLLAAIDAEINS